MVVGYEELSGGFKLMRNKKCYEWTLNRYITFEQHFRAPLFLLALGLNLFQLFDQNYPINYHKYKLYTSFIIELDLPCKKSRAANNCFQ